MKRKKTPLEQYRDAASRTLADLAGDFGVDKSTVLRWETGKVPADRVLEVERITGISRHQLRPDIFGPAPTVAA